MNRLLFPCILIGILLFASCSTTTLSRRYNGVQGQQEAVPIGMQKTSRIGVYLFVSVYPVYFDAGLDATMDEFTKKARQNRGRKVVIVQTDETYWWAILPPISFFITPVTTSVYGEVY
ncbi:MAG: hypothetical protein F9K24_19860 [Leptonema illini]|uniref:Lipoprotein n=2 Tax=Leptonema illini TaxID=183 RepID=H2CJT7_9LEPT|nr:hypothetical protein [Leptonema illini]EHQ05001.1 hypothetical protein Lepil_0294 [Leptonema illini DSM 21528]KAB2929433.1 MAG: hypothetical protein F9K24_19860 [Leptonema illini]